MKKVAILAVIAMLSMSAFAQVKISQGGIVTSFETDASITLSGKNSAEVLYDNILISIPKGQRVVISKNTQGKIFISGTDIDGIKTLGKTLSAKGFAIFVLNPKDQSVERISAEQMAKMLAQDSKKEQKDNEEEGNSFPNEQEYINTVAANQTISDVERELSPSSPDRP